MKKEDIQLLIDFIDEKETSVINKDLDMNNLIRLCKNHSLLPILYKACQKYKVSLTEKQEVYLKKNYQVCLMREATQELEKQELVFNVKSGKDGRTFGTISTKQISEKLNELNYKIDKKQIVIDGSLNTIGTHYVKINLHKKVECLLKIVLK